MQAALQVFSKRPKILLARGYRLECKTNLDCRSKMSKPH